MKTGTKIASIALLFVGLVLVNYLAGHLPVRIDATAEKIYTLSSGTKSILSKIEEPMKQSTSISRSRRAARTSNTRTTPSGCRR